MPYVIFEARLSLNNTVWPPVLIRFRKESLAEESPRLGRGERTFGTGEYRCHGKVALLLVLRVGQGTSQSRAYCIYIFS